MIQVSVPGKLFIAGEYAVLSKQQPAIIAAIDRFLTVQLTPNQEGIIYSSQQPDTTIIWNRNQQHIITTTSNPYPFITTAIEVVESYVQSPTTDYFHIQVTSELDDAVTGVKYGFGSSGAVTVGVVEAVLRFYNIKPTPTLIYKLATIVQFRLGKMGSYGDIAASSFKEALIAYTAVDKQWLHSQLQSHSISEVVEQEWVDFSVEILPHPNDFIQFLVGWTQSSASTDIAITNQTKKTNESWYQYWLLQAKECTLTLIQAFKEKNSFTLFQQIKYYRQLLQELAAHSDLLIETPLLHDFCEIAYQYGGSAKTSGAGGGDCGICFIPKDYSITMLKQQWDKHGIQVLPVSFITKENLYDTSTTS